MKADMRRLAVFPLLLALLCSCGGGSRIDDTQTYPFLNRSEYGVYNLDGKNSSLVYSEGEHQIAVIKGSDNAFRLINPSKQKFFELSGLPAGMKTGDSFQGKYRQNWTPDISQTRTISLTVRKTEGDMAWISDASGVGYIIKF